MLAAAYSLFLSPPAVMQTDGFEYLKQSCPTVLTELLEYVARVVNTLSSYAGMEMKLSSTAVMSMVGG